MNLFDWITLQFRNYDKAKGTPVEEVNDLPAETKKKIYLVGDKKVFMKNRGVAVLDENGRIYPEQLPTSAVTIVGQLDAAHYHTLPDATEFDPGSQYVMISNGYYEQSTAFTLVAGKTLTDVEVAQANLLIANGYVFTLSNGSSDLGTVVSFSNNEVVTNSTTISLPYATNLSATSTPSTVQVQVNVGDVAMQIDGHWIHLVNNRNVDSVNGMTGSVILDGSNINVTVGETTDTLNNILPTVGKVKTVNGKTPDSNGNITLTPSDIGFTFVE